MFHFILAGMLCVQEYGTLSQIIYTTLHLLMINWLTLRRHPCFCTIMISSCTSWFSSSFLSASSSSSSTLSPHHQFHVRLHRHIGGFFCFLCCTHKCGLYCFFWWITHNVWPCSPPIKYCIISLYTSGCVQVSIYWNSTKVSLIGLVNAHIHRNPLIIKELSQDFYSKSTTNYILFWKKFPNITPIMKI